MRKRLTLGNLIFAWFFVYLGILFLNGATWKNPLLFQMASASLGAFLLFHPVYPASWERQYGPEKAEMIIRAVAIVQMLLCFLVRVLI